MDVSPAATALPARFAELRAALGALDARSNRISTLRGLTFLAAAGLGAASLFGHAPAPVGVAAAALGLGFVALVIGHAVLVTRMSELERRVRLVERGLARMAGDLSGLAEKGERFLTPGHGYAGDLDIFGPASLFQLLDAAETGAGEAVLARWLAAPADAAEIAARQEAVRELSTLTRFREDLAAAGAASGTRGRDAEPFLTWAEARDDAPSKPLMMLGCALVPVTLGLAAASQLVGSAGGRVLHAAWVAPLVAQVAVLYVLRPSLERVLAVTSSREAPFARYVALFRLLEATPFTTPRLAALRDAIATPSASRALGRLESIAGFAEARNAGFFAVFANVFLLWDVFAAAALLRWRARSGAAVRRWIESMAAVEALASLATFAWEHPGFAYPEVDGGELRFAAEGLGHPLIPAGRRVENDVSIAHAGDALMVSGSNMSGKSTLLRAVGVNAVLALAGAPVCARKLTMAVCDVRSSMRIKDSLEEGVSHFYAELDRLKSVVDAANRGDRVLFLLDEILHGTNSRERNIGAKAVILHLIAKGAVGAVSSHDLGLADLEGESGGRVHNVHFQELVSGDKMTFDYKLKPGVVTSSNALRLMKMIGIAVSLPEE
jgi:hypothetical protein